MLIRTSNASLGIASGFINSFNAVESFLVIEVNQKSHQNATLTVTLGEEVVKPRRIETVVPLVR